MVSHIPKETTALNNKKKGNYGNFPERLLKEGSDICASALNDIWNNEIITHKRFPNNLELADVTPVFKKEEASLLKNYRPLRVLLAASKISKLRRSRFQSISKSIYLPTCVDVERVTVHIRL